ncbi:hypothetical protein DPX16_23246 [Anabarilius grahami]|uniref:Uncharacterized protein n=1 Tax=Anabarilius grahami TaxID=495550 RepID=A0A3N0XZS9_ANAGA|nr:hypothetical protein DPX16_23246 [Anabarilius grahami]
MESHSRSWKWCRAMEETLHHSTCPYCLIWTDVAVVSSSSVSPEPARASRKRPKDIELKACSRCIGAARTDLAGAFVEHTTPCTFGSFSRCFDDMRRSLCEKPMHLKRAWCICVWRCGPSFAVEYETYTVTEDLALCWLSSPWKGKLVLRRLVS